jgi:ketosteroid isomerase-like protein
MTTTPNEVHRFLVSEYVRLFEARDISGVLDLLTDDCNLEMPLLSKTVCGKDELRIFLESLVDLWTTFTEQIVTAISDNDTAAVELKFDGTFKNGNELTIESVDIFHFRDNKIDRIRVYTDPGPIQSAIDRKIRSATIPATKVALPRPTAEPRGGRTG